MEGPEQEASADTLYVCGIFNGLQACTVNELTDVDKQGEVLRGLMANSRPF